MLVLASIGVGQTITLSLEKADVRDTLKLLLKSTEYSYTIDANVQGTIDAHLNNIEFHTALQIVLDQVGCTYRLEGGICMIVRKTEIPVIEMPNTPEIPKEKPTVRKIRLKSIDPMLFLLLIQGVFNTQIQPEISSLLKHGSN